MRKAMALVLVAGAVVGVLAEWIEFPVADAAAWVPDLIVGWTLIVCGVVAGRGKPQSWIGTLLVACGFTWFLGNFDDAEWAWLAWIGAYGRYVHRGPLVQALVTF